MLVWYTSIRFLTGINWLLWLPKVKTMGETTKALMRECWRHSHPDLHSASFVRDLRTSRPGLGNCFYSGASWDSLEAYARKVHNFKTWEIDCVHWTTFLDRLHQKAPKQHCQWCVLGIRKCLLPRIPISTNYNSVLWYIFMIFCCYCS